MCVSGSKKIDGGSMHIQLKRAYQAAEPSDGKRLLVDRLWPRGISKEDAKLHLWLKELAPSTELRQWFAHDPAKWPEFQQRYQAEFINKPELDQLVDLAKKGDICLVYAAKDERHNGAQVLKAYIEKHLSK